MQLSEDGLTLLRESEGLRLRAYPDPASGDEPWTIGYGTTIYPDGRGVKRGDFCTLEEAERYLEHDAGRFATSVKCGAEAAGQPGDVRCAGLAYNIGINAFRRSTLVRLLNEGNYLGAADEFDRWVYASGKVINGLRVRRDKEQALFNEGIRDLGPPL